MMQRFLFLFINISRTMNFIFCLPGRQHHHIRPFFHPPFLIKSSLASSGDISPVVEIVPIFVYSEATLSKSVFFMISAA